MSKNNYYIISMKELIYPDYKEPLRQVKDGYGYLGTIAITKDEELIQCHICGKLYKSLPGHIWNTHKMRTKAYKEKFSIAATTGLVSPKQSFKLTKDFENGIRKKWGEYTTEELEQKKAKLRKTRINNIKRNRDKRSNHQPKIKLETRNKRGNCPDQLKDKFKQCMSDLGHLPSVKEFKSWCGNNKLVGSIYYYHGNWKNFLSEMNLTTKKETIEARYTKENLIKGLRQFYIQKGYVPRSGKHDSYSSLVGHHIYIRKFGSLNKARIAAGIPIIIEVGYRKWKETMDYNLLDKESRNS